MRLLVSAGLAVLASACVARPIEVERELTVEELCSEFCDLQLCDNAYFSGELDACVEDCVDPRAAGPHPDLSDECIELERELLTCYVQELGCEMWEVRGHGEGPCADERQAFDDVRLTRGCGYAAESVDSGE
jgi:hypothetical protein